MDNNLRGEINQLHAHVCSGLADSNRILILYTLKDKTYSVSDLANVLGLPQPTTSRHLKVLRERGMVSAQRDVNLCSIPWLTNALSKRSIYCVHSWVTIFVRKLIW